MRPQMFNAVVEAIHTHTPEIKSFRFRLQKPEAIEFKPGQFMVLQVPHEGKTVRRLYSIASPPKATDIVEFCVQYADGGVASTYYWSLKEGDPVKFLGPSGQFVLKEPLDYSPVFLCTGTGIAPFRGMVHQLIDANFDKPFWLYAGTRYDNTVLFRAEMEALASQNPNFHYVPVVSRPKSWSGEKGHVQNVFKTHFPNLPEAAADKQFYICGVDTVVKAIKHDLSSWSIPDNHVHLEEW